MPITSRIYIRLVVGLVLTTLILLSGHYFRNDISFRFTGRKEPKIIIMESLGVHEEVIASILYHTRRITNRKITLLVADTRYGAQEMYREIAPEVDKRGIEIDAADLNPDAIILTTCQYDLEWYSSSLKRRMNDGAKLFCIVHHSDKWDQNLLSKHKVFISNDKFSFLALSGHVATDLKHRLKEILPHPPKVDFFVPSFDLDLKKIPHTGRKFLAMQGNITPGRRDYSLVLQLMKDLSSKGQDLDLDIIGSGSLDSIPSELQSRVTIHSDLNYMQYYAVIANAIALIPAFGHEGYYSTTASSTVPAGLISNCPLIATDRILKTYEYLVPDAVYFQKQDQSLLDVVEEIVAMNDDDRLSKKDAVKKAHFEILNMCTQKWADWIRG